MLTSRPGAPSTRPNVSSRPAPFKSKCCNPIALVSSHDCLNRDIEWTWDYFNSVRSAFDTKANAINVDELTEFKFDHPQAWVSGQGGFRAGGHFGTCSGMPGGSSLGSFMHMNNAGSLDAVGSES